MLWLIFVLAAVLMLAIVNIINKHILSQELKDPRVAAALPSVGIFVVLSLAAFYLGGASLPAWVVIAGFMAGILDGVAAFFYYHAISKEDVSRVIPIIMISPVFTIIIAFILLSESFAFMNYAGMSLLIVGAFLVSLDIKKKITVSHILLIAVASAFFWAMRDIVMKGASGFSAWDMLFWVGFGRLIFGGLIFSYYHPHIMKKSKKGVHHLLLNGFLVGCGLLLYLTAISIADVSIVSSFGTLQGLFVFIGVLLLSFFFPKFIHERHNRKSALLRLAAIIIITVGAILAVS